MHAATHPAFGVLIAMAILYTKTVVGIESKIAGNR